MILQALNDYFTRKSQNGEVPPYGLIQKKVDFLIVLNERGEFQSLDCLLERKGRREEGQPMIVPAIGKQAEKHDNSGKDANLLWDKAEFVLGFGKSGRTKLDAFIRTIQDRFPAPPTDIQAILNFLRAGSRNSSFFSSITNHSKHSELLQTGTPILSFRIEGRHQPVFYEPYVKASLYQSPVKSELLGTCLVTGNQNVPIELTHLVIKGVAGTKSAGANLISFNKDPFLSYHWTQSQNAPVSKEASAAYAKALSYLCASEINRIRIADTTTVFWSSKNAPAMAYDLESSFASFFADPPKDDPDQGVLAVKALYEAIYSGSIPVDQGNRFYVLGLAPNAARISVRFWKAGTIKDFADRIKKHFDDTEIIHSKKDVDHLTLNQLLRAIALGYKMDNVPPNLAGTVMESILDGTPYPATLLHQCIRRVRAEQTVTRARAAILKAYINRSNYHQHSKEKEEITVALDCNNNSTGYRLGRLFAVLEKIQEEANPGINATIRDRYYGAASSNPIVVFPQLLKLKNHHLSKLTNQGRKVNFEKELGEIFEGLRDFPPHLSMEDQARFAVGYYHQRQAFFSAMQTK